ncbi:MAG TPA: S8 family serine peptidase [Candidatus Cybelea sp.]
MTLKMFYVAIVGVCASLALAACAGNSSVPSGVQTSQTQRAGAAGLAHSACPQVAFGKATCYALKVDKGVQPLCTGSQCGFGPADLQKRYQLPITKGSGEIVAIVDAGDNPSVSTSLSTYRTQFGLGTANFKKYNQSGQQSNYSPYTGWSVEIALDVEMVSAACPLCTIYLVEANSSSNSDLNAAELEAVKLGAHITSNSWGCYGSPACVDSKDFDTPGVTYVAASGDSGAGDVGAPAVFDSVAAIGGTQLTKSGSTYTESIWNGSTYGCATGIKKPTWQKIIPNSVCAYRVADDASAQAGCSPGVAVYDQYDGGWGGVCGTSAASPLVAGVFGLAGNATKQHGGQTFWKAKHHKHLWSISGSCAYRQGKYTECAGWGSPKGIGAL